MSAKKKQTTYTREYKPEACRLATEAGLKYAVVAERFEIDPNAELTEPWAAAPTASIDGLS